MTAATSSSSFRFVPTCLVFSLVILPPILRAQSAGAEAPYQEVFYQSGKLRLQAYLYKPQGAGPFPAVIYNHGSRPGRERAPTPFLFIGKMLTAAGYVVLVPERRGYGQSDGQPFSEAVGQDRGGRFVRRMQAETDDVLAALDFLKTVPDADTRRVGIMGWSLGGIVTMFAASRSSAFRAVVDQAGAALTWDSSPAMQGALSEAAGRVEIPVLAMDAENDRTTAAVKAVVRALEKRRIPAKLIIYPPYTPPQPPGDIAPGHLIFAAPGAHIWEDDLKTFFAEHLSGSQ